MGFIFYGFLILFTFRVLMDCNRLFVQDDNTVKEIYRWLKVGNAMTNRIISIFIYYFVIIVRDLKLRISADNPNDLSRGLRRQRLFHNIMFVFFIVSQVIIISLQIYEYIVDQNIELNPPVFRFVQYTKVTFEGITQGI